MDPKAKPKFSGSNLRYRRPTYMKTSSVVEHYKEDANLALWFFQSLELAQPIHSLSLDKENVQTNPAATFFVQTTKREKIYCSQRCAWQQTSRKTRRAGGGDEYRKKQRKVMRKRYDRKSGKEKHGTKCEGSKEEEMICSTGFW